MTKKNNAIWYDWNSPSGYELLEIENQWMNVHESVSKTATISKVEQISEYTCRCNSKSRIVVQS